MENRLATPIVILINYKNDLQARIDFPLSPLTTKTIERRQEEIAVIQEAIEHLTEVGKPL